MKHPLLLPALLLGVAGCVFTPPMAPWGSAPMPMSQPDATPVRAEQITPENAQKMSQALAEELDRETQRGITPPALPK
jgi:hypothetical protein